jgi:hypothetical protein
MRDELKGRNLTFTEIAKLVGENWQNLSQTEKEPFESQAQAIKDKYHSDLAEYKKTPHYKQYAAYLQEFKAKHAAQSQGTYSGHCCSTRARRACPIKWLSFFRLFNIGSNTVDRQGWHEASEARVWRTGSDQCERNP